MTTLTDRLRAATGPDRELEGLIFDSLNKRPEYPDEFGWGKAPRTSTAYDTTVCDSCGKAATTIRDLSIQLPDYRGFCEPCAGLSDQYEKETSEYWRAKNTRPDYTASIDAAVTLIPDGWFYCIANVGDTKETEHLETAWLFQDGRVEGDSIHAYATTTAIAICIAALEANTATEVGNV